MKAKTILAAIDSLLDKFADGAVRHQWTHQGACNCGLLAQELTTLNSFELHRAGLQKPGSWEDHLVDYCPDSGYPIDAVIATIIDAGATRQELFHLERLSDPQVLALIPAAERPLDYRNTHDFVRYLQAWRILLSARLNVHSAEEYAAPVMQPTLAS